MTMPARLVASLVLAAVAILAGKAAAAEPPPGFTALFNGRDFSGWRGRPHLDPHKEAATPADERSRLQEEWDRDLAAHWSVKDGVIVNDGQGVYLTTGRDYGDFELLLDWQLPEPCVDSGLYLRGNPQVQIWDPDCERDKKHGCEQGSGGLWNNPAASPEHAAARFPLVKADKAVGEWNTMRITMRGEKVTIMLNGKTVVDDRPLANFFRRGEPLPAKGPIQIQTHGAPIHVRNVFIRELAADRR
ncbi:MAG: DUF1080 domain-containing protein [Planctomycetia bacterium]|jgi:hypothetical protein